MYQKVNIRQNNITKEIRLKRMIAGIRQEQKVTWEELANACEMSRQRFKYIWDKGTVDLWMYLTIVDYLQIPSEEVMLVLGRE